MRKSHFPTFCSWMFGGLNTLTKLAPVWVNGKITVSSLLLHEQAILQFPRLTQIRGFHHMNEGFLSCGRRKKHTPPMILLLWAGYFFSMAHSNIVCTFGSHVLNLDMWCVPYVAALVLTVCSLDPTHTRDTVASGCISVHLNGRESWCNTIIVTLNLVDAVFWRIIDFLMQNILFRNITE